MAYKKLKAGRQRVTFSLVTLRSCAIANFQRTESANLATFPSDVTCSSKRGTSVLPSVKSQKHLSIHGFRCYCIVLTANENVTLFNEIAGRLQSKTLHFDFTSNKQKGPIKFAPSTTLADLEKKGMHT